MNILYSDWNHFKLWLGNLGNGIQVTEKKTLKYRNELLEKSCSDPQTFESKNKKSNQRKNGSNTILGRTGKNMLKRYGHVARTDDNRWTKWITTWSPGGRWGRTQSQVKWEKGMWNKKPTSCYLALYLFLLYKLLNMFRATLCPSSGADDLVVFLPLVV